MPKPKHSPSAEQAALGRVNRFLIAYAKQLQGYTDAMDAVVSDYLAARARAAEYRTRVDQGRKSR